MTSFENFVLYCSASAQKNGLNLPFSPLMYHHTAGRSILRRRCFQFVAFCSVSFCVMQFCFAHSLNDCLRFFGLLLSLYAFAFAYSIYSRLRSVFPVRSYAYGSLSLSRKSQTAVWVLLSLLECPPPRLSNKRKCFKLGLPFSV